MIKRILSIIACFILLCSFVVNAKAQVEVNITPPEDFYILGEDNADIADALGIDEAELKDIEDAFFAVDKDNKRQIRLTVEADSLAKKTVNISALSDKELKTLIPQITGIEDAKGEIIEKDGQKFIKTQLKTKDSGGEYVITQFFTVAGAKSYVLSFYTDIETDRKYIDKTFMTLESDDFISNESQKKSDMLFYGVAAAAIIFFGVCVVVTVTVVRDIKKEKEE